MVLKKISYVDDGKRKSIEVKTCDSVLDKFFGLMFKKSSPPLLFVFNKQKRLSIHSLFCKPFIALWLDDKMNVTKKQKISNFGLNFSGNGKYLLEIPISDGKKPKQ